MTSLDLLVILLLQSSTEVIFILMQLTQQQQGCKGRQTQRVQLISMHSQFQN